MTRPLHPSAVQREYVTRAQHLFYVQDGQRLDLARPLAGEAEGAALAAAPEWVNVLPLPDGEGKIYSRDYRVVSVDDLKALAKRSNEALARQRGGAPVDADHKLYGGWMRDGGGPVLAWAEEFEARTDGLWARVDWLPEGEQAVTSRQYRYTSSVIGGAHKWEFDEDGWPTRLILEADVIEGFGITNIPALETASMFTRQGEDAMKTETLLAIARKLGIADDATPEQARDAFRRFTSAAPVATGGEAAPADDDEDEEPAAAADDMPVAAAGEVPPGEPETPVDGESVEQLRVKLAAATARVDELERDQAEALISALTRDGKLTPAQGKAARTLAAKPGGLADLRAIFANAPRVLSTERPPALSAAETADKPPHGVSPKAWALAADKSVPLHELARKIQETTP